MRSLANFVIRFPKWIIALWILLAGFMAFQAVKLPGVLEGDGFRMDGEHEQVMEWVADEFGMPAETLFLVFDGLSEESVRQELDRVEALGITEDIASPLDDPALHSDGLSYAMLQFGDEADMPAAVSDIRKAVKEDGTTLTGGSAITEDINKASQRDLIKAEAIGLPIALIVLLLAFGSVVAALVPFFVAIATVLTTFGILTILGGSVDLSIFIMNIVPMLGLALSIDFSLLFINRYREERRKQPVPDAVRTTILTAGRSVLFSAFCVFIGLGAMFIIRIEIFQNIGLGGMILVSLAVLTSLTLLPSVLLVLGDRLNKWTVIKVKENGTTGWRKFAERVIRRPVLVTIGAILILGIFVIPVKDMELTIPEMDSLPKSNDSRQAFEKIEDEFGLSNSNAYLIAERDGGWDDEDGIREIEKIQDALLGDPRTDEVTTIFTEGDISGADEWMQAAQMPQADAALEPLMDAFTDGDALLVPVTLKPDGASAGAQDWARDWAEKDTEWNLSVGGYPKFNQEIFDEIWDKIGWVLALIVVSTFIILMIAFRSVLIPLKAILMNIIGLSAAFGALVYIFQWGHFGLEAGTIALIIPVLVFSLVFGLSMDYEVFLISRIQEEYTKDFDNDRATVEGLAATSKIITSAALIMIVLTGAFAFTDVMPVKQIGVGIAIAVAIDATIIRLLLVPSLMKLFGKWNWWLPFRKGPYRGGNWH
ncbi:MMPL family transporter [Edaphobacillus lindanitolerans]|uniref:Putative drug exporter of the RND superfamily n=1 Tax=Edaphobacillus lindanitolerans TaxID=550447 RepID=A0A1U7PP11_9BACI|nr:MMPL family transporter [Edaphobacillus lindanitolerans]SIT88732.1 putative drug exporter of the RND superfamily [Edaphobacillus lindanitolerans]